MENAIRQALLRVGEKINQRVIQRWGTIRNIQGKAYAKDPRVDAMVKNTIKLHLSYGGQKAWVAELGRGSLMDVSADNVWSKKYIASARFNKARLSPLNSKAKKFSIVSREPNSRYKDLDNVSHKATNKFPQSGFNLEYWTERYKTKPYRKYFTPTPPLKIIEDEVRLALPEIKEAIEQAATEYIRKKLLK